MEEGFLEEADRGSQEQLLEDNSTEKSAPWDLEKAPVVGRDTTQLQNASLLDSTASSNFYLNFLLLQIDNILEIWKHSSSSLPPFAFTPQLCPFLFRHSMKAVLSLVSTAVLVAKAMDHSPHPLAAHHETLATCAPPPTLLDHVLSPRFSSFS